MMRQPTYLLRIYFLLASLVSFFLLGSCTGREGEGEYFAFEAVPRDGWKPSKPLTFDVLFPETTTRLSAEVILRMDSRLDRGRVRLRSTLRRSEMILRQDTLEMNFASGVGQWRRPGVVYHEFVAPLAQPLHVPYAGLFVLEVALLDSLPLQGVESVGLHLVDATRERK